MKSPRIGVGYDATTPSFANTRRVLFVVGGVQTELLEEIPTINYDGNIEEIVIPQKPDFKNGVTDEIVVDVQGF